MKAILIKVIFSKRRPNTPIILQVYLGFSKETVREYANRKILF